jgi:hypothetical protein
MIGSIMAEGNRLFANGADTFTVIQNHEQAIIEKVQEMAPNQLLNSSIDDLCDYLENELQLEVPKLQESEITVDQADTKIDLAAGGMYVVRGQSTYVPATQITYYVPFTGDRDFFGIRPSSWSMNLPRGKVTPSALMLRYTTTNHDPGNIQGQFNADLASIKKHLDQMRVDVAAFNTSFRERATIAVMARRDKLLKDQGLVASLGFPLVRRPDAPQTFIAPQVRRKSPVRPPAASVKPFRPEPELAMTEYEHILSVIQNMVTVIERSPQAFKGMNEEHLRQSFLVPLNGHYEGQATGETFNFEGKTDILIRAEGRNIFIAECKLWKGRAALTEAIGQLLRYATWRDTKIALLVFNRNKNFSAVVEQIPKVVRAHPNFKRELRCDLETAFRCVLAQRDDPNRELILTTLAFDVPV